MALLGSLGNLIQKALFNTTLTDIMESMDNLRVRIEELDGKLEREVKTLEAQVAELRSKGDTEEAS